MVWALVGDGYYVKMSISGQLCSIQKFPLKTAEISKQEKTKIFPFSFVRCNKMPLEV